MVLREDFALEASGRIGEIGLKDFSIKYLIGDSPILKLLRKPDFQRETNHWNSEQISTFIASFLDNEIIPSLIFWKSTSFIFIIDGGHRLSALRAWALDDYGAGPHSNVFFGPDIPDQQVRIHKQTQRAVEKKVGRFSTLNNLVSITASNVKEIDRIRANRLFTRTIPVQWIEGSAAFAETSFFKINSQGTPLDEVEKMLIENRRETYSHRR